MTDKVDEKKVIKGKIRAFKRGSALDKQIGGSHYKNAKIDPIEKMLNPGLNIIITPTKPKAIALQRLQPNFSPKNGTERPATISG